MTHIKVQTILALILIAVVTQVKSQSTPVPADPTLKFPSQWTYSSLLTTGSCSNTAQQQSPVDLAVQNVFIVAQTQIALKSAPLYTATSGNITLSNQRLYTITATPDVNSQSILFIPKNNSVVNYNLEFISYRTPGEHTLNGFKFDAELHLVHFANDTQWNGTLKRYTSILVVPLMTDPQAPFNIFFDNFSTFANSTLPTPNLTLSNFNIRQNITSQLSSNQVSYIHYPGSFDVPPCNADVDWYVLTQPVRILPNVTAALKNFLKSQGSSNFASNSNSNARTAQQLNTGLVPDKGVFFYYEDSLAIQNMVYSDDTYAWTAVWSWSIGLALIILITIIICGLYKVGSLDRHKLLVDRQNAADDQQNEYEIVPVEPQAHNKQ